MNILILKYIKKITKELISKLLNIYTAETKSSVPVVFRTLLKYLYLSKIAVACNKKATAILLFTVKNKKIIYIKCRSPPINSKKI